jgi:diaminopimelate epimerase
MFNPDGTEFERSGNGLRILAAHLLLTGKVGEGDRFPVEVGGGRMVMEILGWEGPGSLNVAVEMGKAGFGVEAVGGDPEGFEPGETLRAPDGSLLAVHPVSLGNPHCVVFRKDLRGEDLLELGPSLTVSPAFPAGVNLQLARVVGEGEVEILIWERGVGRTTSSGTSACAVAAASVQSGRIPPGRIRIWMEGGSFQVEVSPQMDIRLEGPVEPVFTGELSGRFLEALRKRPRVR